MASSSSKESRIVILSAMKVTKQKFQWVIKYPLMKIPLRSLIFKTQNGMAWRMKLQRSLKEGHLCFDLDLSLVEAKTIKFVTVEYTALLLDQSGKELKTSCLLRDFSPEYWYPVLSFVDQRNELKNLVKVEEITVHLDMNVFGESLDLSNESKGPEMTDDRLSVDLLDLFESSEFADVTIKCGDKEFKCVKAILAARSKVFLSMFKHDTKEAKLNCVDVEDVSPDVMGFILRYIYSGRIPDQSDALLKNVEPIELLAGADKYGLMDLKAACETEILENLTMDGICYILVMADRHSARNLKAGAIGMMKRNGLADLVKTEDWNQLEKDYPDLAIKVFKSAVA